MSFIQQLKTDIDIENTEPLLVFCFFISGLIDSVSISLYRCFATTHTGNTVLLALGLIRHPQGSLSFNWIKALMAITSFCFGSLFFPALHQRLGSTKRYVIMGSFAIQTMMIGLAAILVGSRITSYENQTSALGVIYADLAIRPDTRDQFPWLDLLPIALLGFQSAGQLYISRVVQKPMLQTIVLTAIYCDTLSSISERHKGNPIMNCTEFRARISSILSLFSGVLIGGALGKLRNGFAGALWLAAGLKVLVIVMWYFWPSARLQEEKERV